MAVKETPARVFRVGLMRSLNVQAQSCAKRACPLRFLLAAFNIIIVMSLASYQMKEDFWLVRWQVKFMQLSILFKVKICSANLLSCEALTSIVFERYCSWQVMK